MSNFAFRLFEEKCAAVLTAHGLDTRASPISLSEAAKSAALSGSWDLCAFEMRNMIATVLAAHLTPYHAFVESPYVRSVILDDGTPLKLAIINNQSSEWYGGESFFASCDFLVEKNRGCFSRAFRFADLGGHQMIWAIYYARTSKLASVISYEPSVLNCLIGLFNCLANGVIDQIEVVPFAVASKGAASDGFEVDKMLVDFMTLPLRTVTLEDTIHGPQDFVKTDIEGYEYEMLADNDYVQLLKSAPYSHFELHLGHLVKRGITREKCVETMRAVGLEGTELYSGQEMYAYLESCDRNSYPAFILKN